jgi:hypothetical protein
LFVRFLDARRNLVGLAVAPTNSTVGIADDNHRREAKSSTAFDHGSTPPNLDGVLDVLRMCIFRRHV